MEAFGLRNGSMDSLLRISSQNSFLVPSTSCEGCHKWGLCQGISSEACFDPLTTQSCSRSLHTLSAQDR